MKPLSFFAICIQAAIVMLILIAFKALEVDTSPDALAWARTWIMGGIGALAIRHLLSRL